MFRKLLSVPPPLPCAFRRFSICELPPELAQIQHTCRAFVDTHLTPIAAALDREARFPRVAIEKLADLGMMRVTVDPEFPGGSGQGMLALSLIVEELSRGCGSTGSIVSIHNCLYANLLNRVGSREQKDRFFRKYSCATLGAFALSEADAGSDVAAMSTRAVQDGDEFVLNGTKAWVTSALEAKSGIIFATVDPELKYKGITAFLVDFGEAPGLTVGRPEDKLGIRASSTCNLILDNVRIPRSNLLGTIGGGFRLAMEQLDRARIGIASQALGIAQASLEAAIAYAKQRIAFGEPLLRLPAVRTRMAEMAVRIESTRLLVRKAATEVERGPAAATCSFSAKHWYWPRSSSRGDLMTSVPRPGCWDMRSSYVCHSNFLPFLIQRYL